MRARRDRLSSRPITAELVGGVGNQLFIYFAGLYLARSTNTRLAVTDEDVARGFTNHGSSLREIDVHCDYARIQPLRKFAIKVSSILRSRFGGSTNTIYCVYSKWLRLFTARNLGYEPSLEVQRRGTHIRGYFQTFVYFERCKQLEFTKPLQLKTPGPNYIKFAHTMSEAKPIVVHVRRGDYRKLAKDFGLLGVEYYEEALSILRSNKDFSDREIWVFSDEIDAVKAEFHGSSLQNAYYFPSQSGCTAVETLFLMSLGAASIISNSTFAWWGAILKTSGPTVAPSTWLRSLDEPEFLIPNDWTRAKSYWLENE